MRVALNRVSFSSPSNCRRKNSGAFHGSPRIRHRSRIKEPVHELRRADNGRRFGQQVWQHKLSDELSRGKKGLLLVVREGLEPSARHMMQLRHHITAFLQPPSLSPRSTSACRTCARFSARLWLLDVTLGQHQSRNVLASSKRFWPSWSSLQQYRHTIRILEDAKSGQGDGKQFENCPIRGGNAGSHLSAVHDTTRSPFVFSHGRNFNLRASYGGGLQNSWTISQRIESARPQRNRSHLYTIKSNAYIYGDIGLYLASPLPVLSHHIDIQAANAS